LLLALSCAREKLLSFLGLDKGWFSLQAGRSSNRQDALPVGPAQLNLV